jgi:hypothetical protein
MIGELGLGMEPAPEGRTILWHLAATPVSSGLCDSCTLYVRRANGDIVEAATARRSGAATSATAPPAAEVQAALATADAATALDGDYRLVRALAARGEPPLGAMSLARDVRRAAFAAHERADAGELATHMGPLLAAVYAVDGRMIAAAAGLELASLLTVVQLRLQNMVRRTRARPRAWVEAELDKLLSHVRRLAGLVSDGAATRKL